MSSTSSSSTSYTPATILRLLRRRNGGGGGVAVSQLTQFHCHLTKVGLFHHPPFLSKLLSLSSNANLLPYAFSLLSSTPTHLLSHSLFSPLIASLSSSPFPALSLLLFNSMVTLSLPVPRAIFPSLLKSCARAFLAAPGDRSMLLRKGVELHCRVFRLAFDTDRYVQNALVSMYARFGLVGEARRVFDEMRVRDVFSWNALISVYGRAGDQESAGWVFRSMPERNVSSWNSEIVRYVRLGDMDGARRIFQEMPERDAVSWNALIGGYARVGRYQRAMEIFMEMRVHGVEPTQLTAISVLGACAETGELELGKGIHRYLEGKGIAIDGYVGNALLDMYAKCGNLRLARQVFNGMRMRDGTSWNAMIVGLAVHGCSEEALQLFALMEVEPDHVTFLGVLVACSHKGLVDKARAYFKRMVDEYKIEPDMKHYGCMIDLLSRCGMVEEACRMIKEMPIRANSVLWKTVLAACRVHGRMDLANEAFRELCQLAPLCGDELTTMSNIYAEAKRWGDVEHLRTKVISRSASKHAGCSHIELT